MRAANYLPIFGINGTDWSNSVTAYINSLTGKPSYWPMQDTSGTNVVADDDTGRNSDLDGANANVLVAQSATGSLGTSFEYNASTSVTDVYSAALNAAFPKATGCVTTYFQTDSWTPTGNDTIFGIQLDNDNRMLARINGTNNLSVVVETQNDLVFLFSAIVPSTVAFYFLIVSWEQNGGNTDWVVTLDGTAKDSASSVGTLTGSLSATGVTIGASSTTPSDVWDGKICHTAIFDRLLTAGEITTLAGFTS